MKKTKISASLIALMLTAGGAFASNRLTTSANDCNTSANQPKGNFDSSRCLQTDQSVCCYELNSSNVIHGPIQP
jgi:hypothetical protein